MDPILIFGYFGFPRLEVAGAAIATVLGQIVAACLAVFMNLKFNPDVHIRPGRSGGTAGGREIYRVGFPSIVMQSIGSVMVFGMNKILFGFTKTATAVFGAYFKLQSFIFMPVFGLNNGMVPIVAYNFGAARMDRVKRTVKLAVCTAVAIMAVGLLIFQLAPELLLSFFDASAEMNSIGSVALRIISISFLFAGFCIIAGSVCQAIGNPFYSLIVSVARQLVVLLPVAWLLAQTGRLELVWLAFPIAELMSLTLSVIFLRRTLRSADARLNGPDSRPRPSRKEPRRNGKLPCAPGSFRDAHGSGTSAGPPPLPSRVTAKWRWAPWADSAAAVVPTAPMACPAVTVSPSSTGGSAWRLA